MPTSNTEELGLFLKCTVIGRGVFGPCACCSKLYLNEVPHVVHPEIPVVCIMIHVIMIIIIQLIIYWYDTLKIPNYIDLHQKSCFFIILILLDELDKKKFPKKVET